jgi:regulator of sigma D
VGLGGDSRDRCDAANKAFEGPVPKELLDYLAANKDRLHPMLRKAWEAAGFKTSGTWAQVFGAGEYTDEVFMAWNYASYVGRVAAAGKAEYPLPMFVNNACSMPRPGGPPARGGGRPQP